MKAYNTKSIFAALCLLAAVCSMGCSKKEPLKLGFVGGLTGRAADLGINGRNGAILAVEQKNAAGGIKGRPIELVIKDDGQNGDTAGKAVNEMIAQKIECIIGPMTSSMAMTMVPLVNSSGSILLSPTVTTTTLTGLDDNFMRVISDTTVYAGKSARYQFGKLGRRTAAAIYDLNNSAYTESWLNDFKKTFQMLGGKVVLTRTFSSSDETVFTESTRALLNARPDFILILGNAVDAAMISQQIRKRSPAKPIVLSEWASTERFIELGGAAVEGAHVAQFISHNDSSARYQAFLKAYRERFGQNPGFAGLAGYDAAKVAIEAFDSRKDGEPLKEAIIRKARFQCVQQILNIDRFGDADRNTFVTVIRNGQYLTQE